MTPRILILGKTGQLATALIREAASLAFETVALGRDKIDLGDAATGCRVIAEIRPDIVINAAAYTAVDQAESEPRLAYQVNAMTPAALAAAAKAVGGGFIQISTDYVFDGDKAGLWRETDPVGPRNVYGASKLAGELGVSAAHPGAVIFRTSWVVSETGHNFVRTMLRLGKTRDELRVVADQFGRPTAARSLAEAILAAVPAILDGVGTGAAYHVSNDGPVTTWHGFSEAIFEAAAGHGGKRPVVLPIPTSAYPTPARRPLNSALDIGKFTTTYRHRPVDWRQALDEIIRDLAAAGEI